MEQPSHKEQKKIGSFMLTLMWIGIFLILGIFFSDVLDRQLNPNQSVQTTLLGNNIKQLSLQRNRQGHYVTNGRINNQDVVFMLDTGATDVSIPESLAKKLNLEYGPSAIYQTANGNVRVYMTRLHQVSIGDIALSDVRATINPGYKSNHILLGMSVLKHLEFTQRGNMLTIRQYPDGQ